MPPYTGDTYISSTDRRKILWLSLASLCNLQGRLDFVGPTRWLQQLRRQHSVADHHHLTIDQPVVAVVVVGFVLAVVVGLARPPAAVTNNL